MVAFIQSCWSVLCQLAPWLLLGMLLSGIMHVSLPTDFIKQRFRGFSGVVQAVLLGVPLPLCSCGVVPAGIGLKNQGASDGASVGFLISTPQTGVDSILVSATFLGWPFAIFKMLAAAVTGIFGGWLTDRLGLKEVTEKIDESNGKEKTFQHSLPVWRRAWDHGVEIVGSIWIWLLVGVVVSAAMETLVPTRWFEATTQMGWLATMVIVLVFSTPLYVCATASVPIAASLVAGGFPPAAAMVFLMAGPATNVTTIGAIYGRFGLRTSVFYLATIVGGSLLAGLVFDSLLSVSMVNSGSSHHHHNGWVAIVSGFVLMAIILHFAVSDFLRWYQSWRLNSDADFQTIYVDGMTCSGCVKKLESALTAIPGVENVMVDLKSGKAMIFGEVEQQKILSVIRSVGFSMAELNNSNEVEA